MRERRLEIADNRFELDGKPFRLMGGALHYARIPQAYWRDRLAKLIDLGCNTIETYGFWNAHEPRPGNFDFSGMLDVVRFVELAGSMGLNVIYRPGPYCCAEWDMGGLPWWLLNEPNTALRCSDSVFLGHVERYFGELMSRLAPLQSTRGGPIIAMQIENEYGYYGNDKSYLNSLRELLRKCGVDVLLFTSDGTFDRTTIANGGLDDLLRTANFGSQADKRFKLLRDHQNHGPLVCMEYWVGWFDEWRADRHATRPASECAAELDSLLSTPDSHAVIYMFQGGTNWGFTAGGNLSDEFKPFVTSYDYDALLTEAGDVTPKYEACREVIHQHLDLNRPKQAFQPSTKMAYGTVVLSESVALDAALASVATEITSATPRTMEQLGEGRGFILYRTEVPASLAGLPLILRGMHDWCHVRINGESIATWYRRDKQPLIPLQFTGESATLEILVHNLARSNFGHRMSELKGLTGGAFAGAPRHEERAIFGWRNFALPLEHLPPAIPFEAGRPIAGPAFHRGTLVVDGEPADTFLKLPSFNLGCVFINGFNIGRYWNVGPQMTLFVPAPFLKSGANDIVVFEALACDDLEIVFGDAPELNGSANAGGGHAGRLQLTIDPSVLKSSLKAEVTVPI